MIPSKVMTSFMNSPFYQMFSDVLRCFQIFPDDLRMLWGFHRCSMDVLKMIKIFSSDVHGCSQDVLNMLSGRGASKQDDFSKKVPMVFSENHNAFFFQFHAQKALFKGSKSSA